MAKFERMIGDVRVIVLAPDGVPVEGVTVQVRPQDEEQFLATAEAVGGLKELHMPMTDEPYSQNAYAWARSEDGEADFDATVNIREPPREREREGVRPPHPFFSQFMQEAGDPL